MSPPMLDIPDTMPLSLADIRTDGGTQSRDRIDGDVVVEYAAVLAASGGGNPFPALTVFYDGAQYWLVDGFHRYEACEQAGVETVDVVVYQGSQRDAILYSVGANASHGLRRSNADKRRAVETLLRDEEWGKRSDRWIAEKCGVSDRFVSGQRPATANRSQLEERTGQDGKTRKLPTKREPAPEAPSIESRPALARQRSAPPVELPDEPDLDLSDELEVAVAAPTPAQADDANPYDETWIDDTIRGVMRVPAALVEPLVARLMNAVAARGVYLTRDDR